MDKRKTLKVKSRCPVFQKERNESARFAVAVATESFNQSFRKFFAVAWRCSVNVPDAAEDTTSDEADSISEVPRTDFQVIFFLDSENPGFPMDYNPVKKHCQNTRKQFNTWSSRLGFHMEIACWRSW